MLALLVQLNESSFEHRHYLYHHHQVADAQAYVEKKEKATNTDEYRHAKVFAEKLDVELGIAALKLKVAKEVANEVVKGNEAVEDKGNDHEHPLVLVLVLPYLGHVGGVPAGGTVAAAGPTGLFLCIFLHFLPVSVQLVVVNFYLGLAVVALIVRHVKQAAIY